MKRISFKSYIYIPIFILAIHFCFWFFLLEFKPLITPAQNMLELLNHWDSGWYTKIYKYGYEIEESRAFFPLYSILIKIFTIDFHTLSPALTGTILSTIFFFTFLFFLWKVRINQDNLPVWLYPKNMLCYLFFLLSPASYIYHTHHTESLFLLLSFLGLYFSYKNKFFTASIIAGLCSVTKNQGILLAVTVAFMLCEHHDSNLKKLRTFIISGFISGTFFMSFLIYQFFAYSNPFEFIKAQSNWHHIEHISEYFKTLIMQNKFQDYSLGAIKHQLFFYLIFYYSLRLWKYSKPISIYCLCSVLILPMQGEVINSFRFLSYLFPTFFIMGIYENKKELLLKMILLIVFIFLNIQTVYNYAILKWAY